MIFVVALGPPAPAGGPGITDWLTGIGTVGLALATVVTLIVTVRITTTDRRRADRERRRERQQDAARRLLTLISQLIPHMWLVPAVHFSYSAYGPAAGISPLSPQVAAAAYELEYGAHAEVAGIGDARAAQQYRKLARLVMNAADGIPGADGRRIAGDLLRYALFVRVSLENVIENGQSLDPGNSDAPRLDRPKEDTDLWEPEHKPTSWLEAVKRAERSGNAEADQPHDVRTS